MNLTSIKMFAVSCLIASTMSACGSDSTPVADSTSTSTIVNGQAIAGAVLGNLTVRDGTGAQVATATVNAGGFTVEIPNASLSQTLDFEVTGTYRDEVSGQTVTLTNNDPLALRVAANFYQVGQTGNAPITPETTIIRSMISNGSTQAQAETAFKNTFGYIPDLTAQPFDPYTTQITTQTLADQTAAFRVGVFSQLGTDLGLTATDLAELPNKFAADLADGTLDGVASGNPVVFGSGVNLQAMNQVTSLSNMVSMAVARFAGSPANVAGVTAPSMGLPPIAADMPGTIKTAVLQDGTVVNIQLNVTNTPPFQTGFRSVKTLHELIITNAATGAAIDITDPYSKINSLSLSPWMYMFSGHGHPTPIGAIQNINPAAGQYAIDAYYLMATGMLMGTEVVPMGQWDLDFKLGDTTSTNIADPYTHTHFFPNVMMNMGSDLLLAKGVNTADTWTDMNGITVPREYRVWLQDVAANAGGGHDLSVYITTLGMDMSVEGMIFPPVYSGFSVMMPSFSIGTVLCEVSTDAGVTWTTMPMTATNGIYKITGLAGLTIGTASTLDIRLTVNGNMMQTAAGSNLQLSFTAP